MGSRVYLHYNHTDACNRARWNARESFRFMYDKPWQHVLDFYSNAVEGNVSVPYLFDSKKLGGQPLGMPSETELENSAELEGKSGRWARVTFKIVVSYSGASFDGWQRQPDLHTVQGVVEKSLGGFVDEKKAQLLKTKCKPLEGRVLVAGRTDKGVSALNQVCAFYTWRKDVETIHIADAVNKNASGTIRVVSISKVSRAFHPNFCAKWRRYLYIFPLDDAEPLYKCDKNLENVTSDESYGKQRNELYSEENTEEVNLAEDDEPEEKETGKVNEIEVVEKPSDFSVTKVDQLLRQLQGKLLSYKMFARDTKAARNEGPPTECFMYHARAAEIKLPCSDYTEGRRVMCVELVANRFLRKMVRVLVATSIREAAAGAEDDALLKLLEASCRRATAPPAPPEGLCLFDVGYVDFDPQISLIQ